jgi:hypothetical protein
MAFQSPGAVPGTQAGSMMSPFDMETQGLNSAEKFGQMTNLVPTMAALGPIANNASSPTPTGMPSPIDITNGMFSGLLNSAPPQSSQIQQPDFKTPPFSSNMMQIAMLPTAPPVSAV